MNIKRVSMLIISALILLYSLFTQPFAMYGSSEFSMNSRGVDENYNSTFTLLHDATLYFKYASKDLGENSVITLMDKSTEETVFTTDDLDDVGMLIKDIPKGTYQLRVYYSKGFLSYNLLTYKK